MGAAQWFYRIGDQVRGPVSPGELRQKASSCEILPDTPVSNRPDGRWVLAEQVQGLFQRADPPARKAAHQIAEKPIAGRAASSAEQGRRSPSPPPESVLPVSTSTSEQAWAKTVWLSGLIALAFGIFVLADFVLVIFSGSLTLEFVAGFIMTWGLGLTPPLVIRYAIVCRPLSRERASLIAAVFSAFFWILFLGFGGGNVAIWIIMFFLARWIMSRG